MLINKLVDIDRSTCDGALTAISTDSNTGLWAQRANLQEERSKYSKISMGLDRWRPRARMAGMARPFVGSGARWCAARSRPPVAAYTQQAVHA